MQLALKREVSIEIEILQFFDLRLQSFTKVRRSCAVALQMICSTAEAKTKALERLVIGWSVSPIESVLALVCLKAIGLATRISS
jgi:hypothetical protein